ncbi:MAG: LLM class flavin-dependent oxidoreductase [Myxococcota bacterium]|jgi:alkanesulfonate monooxygenase SsuD/methylene tetrahydromethanopterin reductase-like flavin-dependent oxidoreductase (luciferase family)|nr:LLM class flavin-dependent oxidoreductase [Myxococcota bacterium]
MEFVISFDMRAPSFGAPREQLYRSALDMAEWADDLGFNVVSTGEHHAADDGYLPSPLPMISAIAARTQRVKLRPNVLLAPLYEPVKLAEDLSVIQILSGGRLQVVIGAGYRPYEFQMFGTRREDRKERYLEVFEVLRNAWTGEEFEYKGRKVKITPQPETPPPLLLGGAHPAVARRAAHIADGFFPPGGENWDVYREERLKLGKVDPGEKFHALGPIYTHVTDDVEAAWAKVLPHAVHCVESYSDWTIEAYGRAAGPFADGVDPQMLRTSGAYQVLPPEQAIEMINTMDDCSTFILFPLLGGIDPDFGWEGLRKFEREVWPHVRHRAGDMFIPDVDN